MDKRKTYPKFTEAKLCKDGAVALTDDDGEVFHVKLHRGEAWPTVSRRLRRFEINEAIETGRSPAQHQKAFRIIKRDVMILRRFICDRFNEISDICNTAVLFDCMTKDEVIEAFHETLRKIDAVADYSSIMDNGDGKA